jgi:hypothetical protein
MGHDGVCGVGQSPAQSPRGAVEFVGASQVEVRPRGQLGVSGTGQRTRSDERRFVSTTWAIMLSAHRTA